jgi:hypothetical protein
MLLAESYCDRTQMPDPGWIIHAGGAIEFPARDKRQTGADPRPVRHRTGPRPGFLRSFAPTRCRAVQPRRKPRILAAAAVAASG